MPPKKLSRQKKITLDGNSLDVFYLMNAHKLNRFWKDEKQQQEMQQLMAHMILCIGSFNLSTLLQATDVTLYDIFDSFYIHFLALVGHNLPKRKHVLIIQDSLAPDEERTIYPPVCSPTMMFTKRMLTYSTLLLHLIQLYSEDQIRKHNASNFDFKKFKKQYDMRFRLKTSVARGIAANIVPKSLSREQYADVFHSLNATNATKTVSDKNVAILMMLFMGLTAEEVCALTKKDYMKIKDYSIIEDYAKIKDHMKFKDYASVHCVQITKECLVIKQKKEKPKYITSNDLSATEQYRNVPVPAPICQIWKPNSKSATDAPLLCDDQGDSLKPDILSNAMQELFSSKNAPKIRIASHNPPKTIHLVFSPKTYKRSLKRLWRLFGMQDNEIRYLMGERQIDTAGKHYIDFNNPHKQYCMLTQMNLAMSNLFVSQPTISIQQSTITQQNLKKKLCVGGMPEQIWHARLQVFQAVNIELVSQNGLSITKR